MVPSQQKRLCVAYQRGNPLLLCLKVCWASLHLRWRILKLVWLRRKKGRALFLGRMTIRRWCHWWGSGWWRDWKTNCTPSRGLRRGTILDWGLGLHARGRSQRGGNPSNRRWSPNHPSYLKHVIRGMRNSLYLWTHYFLPTRYGILQVITYSPLRGTKFSLWNHTLGNRRHTHADVGAHTYCLGFFQP